MTVFTNAWILLPNPKLSRIILLTYQQNCFTIYLLTYLLHGAESLFEANRFSALSKISLILWNPKVHYRIHKCPPPVSALSQLVPVHKPTSHFLKNYLDLFFPSTPGSSKWSLSFRFPSPKPCIRLSSPPLALSAPPISFFSILSLEQYWMRSTDN